MKNLQHLSINFYNFVKNNLTADPHALLLKASKQAWDFPVPFAVTQIECRRKARRKLARYLANERFIFPCVQVAEQSTHASVADYHASLISKPTDMELRVIDITAGLGIDAFAIAERGHKVTAIEIDEERAEAISHNAAALGLSKVKSVHTDSMQWLREHTEEKFDVLFVDPARRDAHNRRKFFFHDCVPDILSNMELLRDAADKIIIKGATILEPKEIIASIPGVEEIHIVCVKGECKEVLTVCSSNKSRHGAVQPDDCRIIAVDLPDDSEIPISRNEFLLSQLGQKRVRIAEQNDIEQGWWLYDPNAALHKLKCADALSDRFPGLMRLSPNTDLYVSPTEYTDFPGRKFRISAIGNKNILKDVKARRVWAAVRNYPMEAEALSRTLKHLPGEEDVTVYGCRIGRKERPSLLLCKL